jgi:hypothetical protein
MRQRGCPWAEYELRYSCCGQVQARRERIKDAPGQNNCYYPRWMPTDHIIALQISERYKLNRAIEVLQGPVTRRGRPPKNATSAPSAEPLKTTEREGMSSAGPHGPRRVNEGVPGQTQERSHEEELNIAVTGGRHRLMRSKVGDPS